MTKGQLTQRHVTLCLGSMSQPTHVGLTSQPNCKGSMRHPILGCITWSIGSITWPSHYDLSGHTPNPSSKEGYGSYITFIANIMAHNTSL